nr:hypothetical protein [Sodalis-like endosymbiont of Proechinophthirus fluctus]
MIGVYRDLSRSGNRFYVNGIYYQLYPIALAPCMWLNAFFTYTVTVVLHMDYTWQINLGAVFLSALIFISLSIFKIHE